MSDTLNDWFGPESATFGDRLAGARENAGMTQAQLAQRLGVQFETLKSWEEDMDEPRANRLSMMAGLLNVSMTWLINGTGDGVSSPGAESDSDSDLKDILLEMRSLKSEMIQNAEALARLEKKLRVNAKARA